MTIAVIIATANVANAQDLTQDLTDNASIQVCVEELQSMNPNEGDMRNIQVGESLTLPECAGNGTFITTDQNANMVRRMGGWGIVVNGQIGRFPTDEEFAKRTITIPALIAAETITETPANTADIPWWIYALIAAIAILTAIGFYSMWKRMNGIHDLIERRFLQFDRRHPIAVGDTTEEEVLREDAYASEPVIEPAVAGDHFQRSLSDQGQYDWRVVDSSIERVYLNGGPAQVQFGGYMRGLNEVEPYQRAMTFTDTPAWRATVRNTSTGETREIVALAQCFNEAYGLTGVTVTKSPSGTIEPEVSPLLGTTATVTEVEGENGSTALTLDHPTLGTISGYVGERAQS